MVTKQSKWEKHIRDQAESELSIREYCEKHEIDRASFYNARSKQKKASAFSEVLLSSGPSSKQAQELHIVLNKSGLHLSGTVPSLDYLKEALWASK